MNDKLDRKIINSGTITQILLIEIEFLTIAMITAAEIID